jgi:cyclic pyranopterin phosphate synthase
MSTPPLTDAHGRGVSYMRLSVTDRCNLNCFYCRSKDMKLLRHQDILTYEELLVLARIARDMRVEKLRLTGGEPFARLDFLDFLAMLRRECPDMDLRMTTNATLLGGKAARLRELGVTRLNVSLDTLDPAKFQEITGRDAYADVRAALSECRAEGLKLKLNAVAMKGVNDMELPAFLDLARELDMDVRFIEFMPVGGHTRWDQDLVWSSEDIVAEARKHLDLAPVEALEKNHGPARIFALPGGRGRLGVISALSNHFCRTCNRLRITSDGRLRTCLFSDKEYRLRALLRHPKLGEDAVRTVLRRATMAKPLGYELLKARRAAAVCGRGMSAIGG